MSVVTGWIYDLLQRAENLLISIDNAVGGTMAVDLPGTLVEVSATMTRPDNATPYTALDVVGTDAATNINFANAGIAGRGFAVMGARLRIDVSAVPAGMGDFRLHLYNAAPTAITDNLAYNLPAADRAKYLGYITIPAPVDIGDTIWAQVDNVNLTGELVSTSIFGILQTVEAYTPAALTVSDVAITVVEV